MGAIMIAGTSSWAGKSVLATAVCASLRRKGVRVAPFKAVNMSNNARVADGGEIGAAQYFQALAAGVTPSVYHNPVLVKPETHTSSQVVRMGRVDRELSALPWRDRAQAQWRAVREAYDALAARHDVIVIEGAGSPAEINLADVDLANLRIGRHAEAPMLLVADIDRGGAFAHLYGTWALLDDADRGRVRGFVLNKFRGDAALLRPGPELLERRTGVPTLGVVPMLDHGLPDEDGADPRPSGGGGLRVRVVRAPGASNLDEWWPLREVTDFRWALTPQDLADAELIVLPGSKTVLADLAWLRDTGLAGAVQSAATRGVRILAVCGGTQLLGTRVSDPQGVEGGGTGGGAAAPGLGLLPVETTLGADKLVGHTPTRFADLPAPWHALSGLPLDGYEIHYGRTRARTPIAAPVGAAFDDGSGFVTGSILAVYTHGLVENAAVLSALAGAAPRRSLAQVLDGLADLADDYLDLGPLLD
jgi:adenosylcobyric acid synthase